MKTGTSNKHTGAAPRRSPTAAPRSGARRRLFATLAAFAAITIAFGVSAPASFAADPTHSQYCDGLGSGGTSTTGENCNQDVGGTQAGGQGVGGGQAPSVSSEPGGLGSRVGSLPFTGWDLVTMASIALALTASGLALARLTSGRRPQG